MGMCNLERVQRLVQTPTSMSLRLAVVWPRPRADRWKLGQVAPEAYPDLSDGLLYLEKEGFRVTIEDALRFPWNPLAHHDLFGDLDPLRALRVMSRRRHYDAIVSVGCATAYYLVWMRRVLRLTIPIILIDPALSYSYARRKRLQDKILPFVDKVIVYGRTQLDYLRTEYGSRVDATFVPHRADTEFYRPVRENGKSSEGQPYILSVGNDISRDFDTLVGALPSMQLGEKHRHRCLIHTSRPLTRATPDLLVCRDKVPFTELRELYQGATVFVLPLTSSIHAGGINSLVEAMAMAKPVVVSRSAGILDYVVDGHTARVVEPGDAAGLGRAVTELLARPEDARRLGENARRFIGETCANVQYARALGAIIREAIDTRPKGLCKN